MRHTATTEALSGPQVQGVLVAELSSEFQKAAEQVVPWFVSQMPPMYFQDTPPHAVHAHLRAIIAAKARSVFCQT